MRGICISVNSAKNLEEYAGRICSQNGEDGIIEYLLGIIGEGTKYSVEFGFGNQANTLNLLSNKGWSGALFDSDGTSTVSAFTKYYNREDVYVKTVALTPANIMEEFDKAKVPETIDVLSIDVDGMDLHLLRAIKNKNIRMLVCEYNASFGPSISVTVPYSDNFNRHTIHPEYHGASLMAITKVAKTFDLKLVGCEGCGINAFYVNKYLPVKPLWVDAAFRNHSKRAGTWVDQLANLKRLGVKLEEV